MFRRDVKPLDGLLLQFLRANGLETPLLQRRLIASWPEVVGENVAKYTGNIFISNQTLMVKINNAALKAELSMMRTQLTEKLNAYVGARLIYDIRIY
jgi:predicted nucleic acid-binding Zn ribbon protein